MKKIVSGNNITVMSEGKPHMFVCGEVNNTYLFNYLNACEDEEKINRICTEPLYRNYIQTYNDYPKQGQELFEHGHKVSYVAVDSQYKIQGVDYEGNATSKTAIQMLKVKDMVVPVCSDTIEGATASFVEISGAEPDNILVFCKKCLSLNSIIEIESDKRKLFSKEGIVNV